MANMYSRPCLHGRETVEELAVVTLGHVGTSRMLSCFSVSFSSSSCLSVLANLSEDKGMPGDLKFLPGAAQAREVRVWVDLLSLPAALRTEELLIPHHAPLSLLGSIFLNLCK